MVTAALVVVSFLFLFFLGIPAFVALGIVCIGSLLLLGNLPMQFLVSRTMESLNSWSWMCIPLFLLAGRLLLPTGITRRLIDFSIAAIGHIPGGLSHVNVAANTLMAGMSGSCMADLGAIGPVLIPAMKKEGYGAGYSAAISAVGSVIGLLIPPSSGLLIYGIIAKVSILRLFIAGIIPGLLTAIALVVTGYLLSLRRGYTRYPRAPFRKLMRTGSRSAPAILLPVIIIGGMRVGLMTATEAGAVSVVYALVCGVLIYRELTFGSLVKSALTAASDSGAIMAIIVLSMVVSSVLSVQQVIPEVVSFMTSVSQDPLIFVSIVSLFILVLGMFMDTMTIMIILIPFVAPIAQALGIDLVYFGVVFTYVIDLGVITPPYGIGLLFACRLAETDVWSYTKEGWQVLLASVLVFVAIILVPQFSLFLPNLIAGSAM